MIVVDRRQAGTIWHKSLKNFVAAMSTHDPIDEAFQAARRHFLSNLKAGDKYNFSQYPSIDDVYDATDKIQQEQHEAGTLQSLNKIRPYLDCLTQYVGVIDTFAQAKADILCLIWVCNSLLYFNKYSETWSCEPLMLFILPRGMHYT